MNDMNRRYRRRKFENSTRGYSKTYTVNLSTVISISRGELLKPEYFARALERAQHTYERSFENVEIIDWYTSNGDFYVEIECSGDKY